MLEAKAVPRQPVRTRIPSSRSLSAPFCLRTLVFIGNIKALLQTLEPSAFPLGMHGRVKCGIGSRVPLITSLRDAVVFVQVTEMKR